MIGLGLLGNPGNPPISPYQPPLADGIHLRWAFARDLGFPWHGFYLFRRPARPGRPLCLSSVTGGLKKGNWPDRKHYTAIGLLSSDTNLLLTEDFTPGIRVEFALGGRKYLRFDFPAGEPARRVELRIGFPLACLDVEQLISTPVIALPGTPPAPVVAPGVSVFRPNPVKLQGLTFEVKGGDGKAAAQTQFDSISTSAGQLVGLACGYGLTLGLPAPSDAVELLITRTAPPMTLPANVVEAFDSNNKKVATANVQSPAGQAETVKLNGQGIARIEISGIRNTAYLHRICSANLGPERGGEAAVKLTAYAGSTPVRRVSVESRPGQIVSVSIEADALTAVELGPGRAALVDLCYVPVAQDATQGWQRLRAFPYPMGLPVSQPDYPCRVANPQALLTQRVRYQLPPAWDGSSFTQLHDQLVELVKGGPTAAPMVERIFAAPPAVSIPPDPHPPQLGNFYILDMILLGALHPALAQLVGLYWVDQTAEPEAAYDYLIVADHTGVGERNAAKVLTAIQSSGFAQLDGYIVFNKRKEAAPPLPAPVGLKTYELPGGTFPDAQGQLPQASNNGGLRWDVGWDDSGALPPDQAVMYLVWRAYLGNAATPAPVGNHDLITKLPPDKPRPLLVTEPRLPNGAVPQRSPGWPPDPLHYIDRNVPEGWYSYQVSGIDLFGRHSLNSAPASLRLLDLIPPPMPTGVEAHALDPDDPFVKRDAAYKDWHNSLDAAIRQTLVGLRVRWRWTKAHQQQAPDASEFRIYFHPGSDLPPAHDLPQSWQERFHVVGYNQHFYSINPAGRNFLSSGGTDSVSVTAAVGAKWWAASSDPAWLNITSGSSGSGGGTVTYSVAPNPGAARTGTLSIAGHAFVVSQQDASSTASAGPAFGAPEDRVYEVFLPLPSTLAPVGLTLSPSLAEPVVYANVGVSAADAKPHTNDQRGAGAWANRPGNEGRVGPPAKIYRVLRAKPAPPAPLADAARVYASPADYHNRSFYTYRWQTPAQADNLKLHLFRAMDDAVFKADWFMRTTRVALDPNDPQHHRFFPSGWGQNASRQRAAANALNAITSQADYGTLSNDAKELLARLPGNDGCEDLSALEQRDWAIRQSRQNLSAAALNFPEWDANRRQAVANELDALVLSGPSAAVTANDKLALSGTPDLTRVRPHHDFVLLKSDAKRPDRQYRIAAVDATARTLTLDETPSLTGGQSAWAISLYRTLSDDGLRALAILPGNESAFVQVTIDPLDSYEVDPADAAKLRWRDRRGPDNADDFPLHPDAPARRAYVDTLDGRSTNRYLYRAAFVDGAHNHGEPGLPGPVVYLPNVVPPRAPVITSVLGGDRETTLKWASNREPDLAEYRVYCSDDEQATRDLRLMTLVHTEAATAADPAVRPAEVVWTHGGLTGGSRYYYRIAAADEAGNVSAPSRVFSAVAVDTSIPDPPVWLETTWVVLRDADQVAEAWPADGVVVAGTRPALRLVWSSPAGGATFFVARRARNERVWRTVAAAGDYREVAPARFMFYDENVSPGENYSYRIRVTSLTGVPSVEYRETEVARPRPS